MRFFSAAAHNLHSEFGAFRKALCDRPTPDYRWDLLGMRRIAFRFAHHLLEEHHDPRRVGWAVFWGVLIGTTPFFGFHLLICLVVAFLLRLNKLIVYAAANISVPVLAPFLIFASYQSGYFVFNGEAAPISLDTVKEAGVESFKYWLVGSLLFGGGLGAMLGFISFLTMRSMQKRKDRFRMATTALAQAFGQSGRMAAGLAKGKTRGDPLYKKLVDEIPPNARILDLGGGQGYLCILHRLYHGSDAAHAIWDWDQRKLMQGRDAAHAAGFDNFEFKTADVFALDRVPAADVVCLIDVLHYQPPSRQDHLLKTIATQMRPGDALFIRDINADLKWRTQLTLLQERFSLGLGLTKAKALYPRSATELIHFLSKLGFFAELEPCWQGTPFANVLIRASKQ